MKTEYTSTIPFSGFYETIHGSKIDDDIQYYIDCRSEDKDMSEEQYQEFTSDIWDNVQIDFNSFKNDFARAYVNQFASEYDLDGIEFESVESPRFYNYSTDRIFVKLTRDCIKDIIRRTDKEIFETVIKERFTSYDGFASFYSNDLAEWPRFSKWDHNQIGALIESFWYTEAQLNPEKDYLPEFFYDIEIDGMKYVDDKTAERLMNHD